jgi:hypothetical protein
MKQLVILSAVILLSTLPLIGQKGVCKVGSVDFKCPSKYYPEVQVSNPTIRLFKYRDGGGKLYFFMAYPTGDFDPAAVSKLIPGLGGPFEWKTETDALVMDLGTKYKFDLRALLGLSDKKLIEVKSFTFIVNDKKIILGYVSDWSEDPESNRAAFRAGKGIGDNASACNQVVTALNSVTHEFREDEQGCTLTALAPSK